MSNILTPPFPILPDVDGSPLNEGFIFIGEKGLDPETHQVQVYWDEAHTQPAEQPIRTRNGYIVKDGLPAKIFVESQDCSMAVKNRNSDLILINLIFDLIASKSYVRNQVQVETDRATTAETSLQQSISSEVQRATTIEASLQNQINANGVGNKAYKTYAEMDADKANIPAKSKVTVTNDPDTAKDGDYQWDGTVFTKSNYDPVTQANTYTNTQVLAIGNAVDIKRSDDPSIICFLADAAGSALAYYDKVKECFVGAGLLDSVFDLIKQLKSYEDSRYIVVCTDANGRILLGWDKLLDQPIGFGSSNSQASRKYKYFAQKPVAADINHMLAYGESLSVGARATTILSTSQPYSNITFGFTVSGTTYASPRMDVSGTSIQPLTEVFYSPASDGGTDRGETCCSGAANYASLTLLKQGVSPVSHVILGSTAGQGSAKIVNIAKGTPPYSRLINHINKAKELNVGKTYKGLMTPFIIGSNDASAGTSYSDFKEGYKQVCVDINTDLKALSGQAEDVVFALAQVSYGARTQQQISKAIWDLTQENSNIVFATPLYHFPYDDGVHLTNVGYKWLAAYFGRVYAQYISEGRYPDYIKPLSAYVSGNKLIVKFDVPTWPLQIDTTTLANTTNAGFKVMNGGVDVPISSVTATSDTVTIELSSTPTTNLQVRYALDYLGTGLNITNGASGNLRDSTTESTQIGGASRPLYHVCPHFEMTAYLDKGI